MTQFDLCAALKQITPGVRQELLSGVSGLAAFDWKLAAKKRNIGPLFAAVRALPSEQQRELNLQLRGCWALKSKPGLKIVREELAVRLPAALDDWAKQRSPMDKMVWTYIRCREAVEAALVFARADRFQNRRSWRRWPGVSCGAFAVTDTTRASLKQLLIEHHDGEGRGDRCEIHHYSRPNGAEYFFAYLPDWPEDFMIFNREGELKSLDVPAAFTILFVFMPESGAIEILAPGTEPSHRSLRQRFYKAMTQTDVSDAPPSRPAFELDHLLDDGFEFVGHDTNRVSAVSVVRMTLMSLLDGAEVEAVSPRFAPGLPWRKVLERIDGILASLALDRSQVGVDEVVMQVECVGEGERRGHRFRYRVTPRTCDLKSMDDDDLRMIGENCNRSWRIDRG